MSAILLTYFRSCQQKTTGEVRGMWNKANDTNNGLIKFFF